MVRYSLFVLKVPLNANQSINLCRPVCTLQVVAGCTCRCCVERGHGGVKVKVEDDEAVDGRAGGSSWWDVQVVYADTETRSEFDYGDVQSIKRCRRRKSRLVSHQRRPAVVLRDTADRLYSRCERQSYSFTVFQKNNSPLYSSSSSRHL